MKNGYFDPSVYRQAIPFFFASVFSRRGDLWGTRITSVSRGKQYLLDTRDSRTFASLRIEIVGEGVARRLERR